MPHLTFEYTDNLGAAGDIPGLVKAAAKVLLDQNGLFPPGGIRVRALRLTDYCVADGSHDDAFVHGTLKIGKGRTDAEKTKTCEELFALMQNHFADLFAKRYLALSLEFQEFSETGTWKKNNIHSRYRQLSQNNAHYTKY